MRSHSMTLVTLAVLACTTVASGQDNTTWWSLHPLNTSAPPSITGAAPTANPIDAFILKRLADAGIPPSPPASRRVLVRRLAFDLHGLPPSPSSISTFLTDNRSGAWPRLVEQHLAHPHYGERWGRHWLDIVRYGESQGFERDKLRPNAWRYRDWVITALNADTPYNRFTAWQLAGDVLQPTNPAAVIATGFLVAGSYDEVGNSQQSDAMKKVVRQDELEEVVSVVGQAFLGLTIHCARCHDHKFDPIPQKEYYRMASALDGVRHGLRTLPGLPPPKRTSSPASAILARRQRLQGRLSALELPATQRIIDKRKTARGGDSSVPHPYARWDFIKDARDSVGQLDGIVSGDARVQDGHLVLPIRGYVTTPPIPHAIRARTLEAWVQLDDTKQRGGGVVALQAVDGAIHDAIAFGELEPERWNLASEDRNRTISFDGPKEQDAGRELVHLAFVFDLDGSVRAYRNGQPYGRTIRTRGPVRFAAGKARLLIGLRHSPTLRERHLRGRIDRVQLHLTALSPKQVLASAGPIALAISEQEFQAALTPAEQQVRRSLQFEIKQLNTLAGRWKTWKTYAVSPRPPGRTRVLDRGDPKTPRDIVSPGGVSAVPGGSADFGLPADAGDHDRRRALAQWITHRRNPLFARVIVNRIWLHHFGAGLVDTPSDLGLNGGLASHPALLDWLAHQLRSHDWSLKHIHRLILNSTTYQQASRHRKSAAALDASNRLVWRHSPRRLEAEALRDSLLMVAGSLNREIGGPGYYDFTTFVNNSQFYDVGDPLGISFNRRSIYRTVVRSGRNRFLDAFDCPDPSTKTPKRAVTTTPLQALSLLNSDLGLRLSDTFAARLRHEAGPRISAQVRLAFQLCFARPPTVAESRETQSFVAQHGLPALARVLFNANEFLYVD